ncbi:hypothetical protein [Iningainema tapete]|uniref:Uncharacterized protein n=1 Tax=Iningainema tapete BLCC-T55 TaxID=2748662 RepID=A0A8J6XNB2_9CYAN|nr:hypothetical protein [Iningainema tapete]MBD2774186.1 hypothetical protein [Iningainema tapete BLCC-T55]
MHQSKWFQILRSLGLEFWLPLPLLGLAFWVGGGLIMDGILSRPDQSTRYLRVETKLAKPKIIVLSIKAKINQRQGTSSVYVKTASSALKELEFEFPFTEFAQVEAAISKELGLQPEEVRKLIHYQSSL